jgi:type II secretory pathway pseudopilin PulG
MKKILSNQKGATLIETVAATAIIILLLLTVLGALLFGQGVIVGSDEKNNAASTAQEIIDSIMVSLSNKEVYTDELVDDAKNMGAGFDESQKTQYPRQYYIVPMDIQVDVDPDDGEETTKKAYQIYVRVYYNQGESYVDLTAFNKQGGVWDE